jgi:hypothetical protein
VSIDFAISIAQLQQKRSQDKETFNAVNALTKQALLRFEQNATGTSDGAGTWLTLWSGTMPKDCKFSIDSSVSGAGSTGGFAGRLTVGLQDIGGTVGVIGATSQVVWEREDVAAMDHRFDLTGSVLSIQVRDDGTVPMTWKVFIEAVGTAT